MSIAQRYLTNDDRRRTAEYLRSRFEEGNVPEDDQKDLMLADVSTYTENTIDAGADPQLESFLNENPQWDREELLDTIEAEMNRVMAMSRDGNRVGEFF